MGQPRRAIRESAGGRRVYRFLVPQGLDGKDNARPLGKPVLSHWAISSAKGSTA